MPLSILKSAMSEKLRKRKAEKNLEKKKDEKKKRKKKPAKKKKEEEEEEGKRRRSTSKKVVDTTDSFYSTLYRVEMDTNENAVGSASSLLKPVCVSINVVDLPVGDFFVRRISDGNVVAIIERKTLQDMYSSIIDGRYREQFQRMKDTECCHVFYLMVETDKNWSQNLKNPYQGTLMVSSAEVRININGDGRFSTIHVYGDIQFAKVLNKIISCLHEKYCLNNNIPLKGIPYDCLLNRTVRKKKDRPGIYLDVLQCIPGVALEKAMLIKEIFPTFREFYRNLDGNGPKSIKNKVFGIGKKISDQLYEGFIDDVENFDP